MVLTPVAIAALLIGLYMAWSIGANDVANAMGTSVGSRALTLRKAIILAAIFEFAGAVLVGGHVTDTVRKGIVDFSFFSADPQVFVRGMIAALLGSALWLNVATVMGLPVSTTHSIVGGVLGFGLLWDPASVRWVNLGTIVASWFVFPLCGLVIAYVVFRWIRTTILDSHHPVDAARRWAPHLAALVVFVLALSTIYKGLKNLKLDLGPGAAMGWSAVLAGLGFVVCRFIMMRLKLPEDANERRDYTQFLRKIFVILQVMTACTVAFAHGANDVANAVGPLAAVLEISRTGVLAEKVAVNPLILLVGGVGIVVGLATYGYKVIHTVGEKVTELTPSRGFSAELGAAITVLACSKAGMPISTTHVLVGAVIGVGLARGMVTLNMRTVKQIVLSWFLTVPAAAGVSMLLFLLLGLVMG